MNLRAEEITFSYQPHRLVLNKVTLDVKPATVTALFGPNGSGKSTLLRCLNGTLRSQAGSVMLDNKRLDTMSRPEIARKIAVVPQDTSPDVPFTAGEMVMLGRFAHGNLWGEETPEDQTIVKQSLAQLNASNLAHRFFHCLSGGERQRIVLARALAQKTPVLLLDEPNIHLDIPRQLEMFRLVRNLACQGKAILMACHDIFMAPLFVDHAVLLRAGTVYASGPVRTVLTPDNLRAVFGTSIEVSWHKGFSFTAALGRY